VCRLGRGLIDLAEYVECEEGLFGLLLGLDLERDDDREEQDRKQLSVARTRLVIQMVAVMVEY
jgi:hypothetical protein